jgi:SAM-dependent methyltransferase
MNRAETHRERLYGDLAHLWPWLSPPEDYATEAEVIAELWARWGTLPSRSRRRPRLVELGAGGGHTLHYLAWSFEAIAVDRSLPMLRVGRMLNPGVPPVCADMRRFSLTSNGRADLVLLHDAADYLLTAADVESTLSSAAASARPGALLVVVPTYTAETFDDGAVEEDACFGEGVALRFVCSVHADADRRGEAGSLPFQLRIEMRYRAGDGPEREAIDNHACAAFPGDRWREWITDAGFDLRDDPDAAADFGTGDLFLATRR